MAPQLKADASTSAKMLDITHTIWSEAKSIPITTGTAKRTNGHPNKNPKANAEIELVPFKLHGEETTQVYIADAWPIDYELQISNAKERRIAQGQGATTDRLMVVGGKAGFVAVLNPTRKHWTRGERRARTRVQRRARKVMRRAAK